MALFDQTIIDKICTHAIEHYQKLGVALDVESALIGDSGQLLQSAPLVQNLKLLVRIANGEQIRVETSKAEVAQVEAALVHVQATLFDNAIQGRATIQNDFWSTDIGVLFSRVRWWLSADELITISNAAALAFGDNTQANRMKIVRAIDNGQLDWIPDPSVVNPQQNRRVLRPQVERLGEQRRRPE